MTIEESVELVNAELPELRKYCKQAQDQFDAGDQWRVNVNVASRKQILAAILRVYHNRLLNGGGGEND